MVFSMNTKHETKQQNIDVLIKCLQYIQKHVIPMDRTDLTIIKYYPKALKVNIIRNKNHEIIGYIAWQEIGFINKKAKISSLAVLPQYQNKGYGSKLLNYTIQQISKQNLTEIKVTTWRTNNKALRFYLKHGFTIKNVENNNITLSKTLKMFDG